jgi:hypothetical protein
MNQALKFRIDIYDLMLFYSRIEEFITYFSYILQKIN